jgi:hypothetical protein
MHHAPLVLLVIVIIFLLVFLGESPRPPRERRSRGWWDE